MQELESGDEAEAGVDPQKAKDIVFEKNGRGHFILPPLDDQKTTKQRQKVIRGYIGAVYRESFKTILISVSYSLVGEFTGYSKAVFPYLLASAEGQNIYSPECAPDGFSLIDPDHITGMNINLLHNHWLQRQKKKLQPFVILNSGPLHRGLVGKSEKKKGKKKIDYVPVSSDDGDGEDTGADGGESEDENDGRPPPKFGPPGRKQGRLAPDTPDNAPGPSKLRDSKKLKDVYQEPAPGPVDKQVRICIIDFGFMC
jgi:hypothetical protein